MNFLLYGELYFAFFQVGALAFGGGLATLPLLEGLLVHDKAWIGVTEWSDVITISNMTPGPIAINAATFIGTKIGSGAGGGLAGRIVGSLVATCGVISPQLILMTILAYLLYHGRREIKSLTSAIQGLRSGAVGLIAAVTADLFLSDLFPRTLEPSQPGALFLSGIPIDMIACITFAVSLVFLLKKVNMLYMLAFGAVFGILAETIYLRG